MNAPAPHHPLLRRRDGHHARVSYAELFFDLIYVFAVTQLSHRLLHDLTAAGVVQTLILWFAVWLGWQYTCWVTNWFDPETPRIRGLLFATMLLALVMSSAIDGAFGERGLVFALAYVAMQVGRSAYIVWELGGDHPLAANYQRILGWLVISACFWIAGGLAGHWTRAALWTIAVACEYVSPMVGFALPGLGRSKTSDWTIEGGHLAERCQLFVIVALGETLLATGAMLAKTGAWNGPVLSAMLATFLGTLAMWWLYFGTSSEDATGTITRSDDPGRIGAYFHYVHALLVAGIIATAVGNDLVMAHPHDAAKPAYALVLAAEVLAHERGEVVHAARGIGPCGQANLQVVVAHEAGKAIALHDQLELARLEVEQVDVVPARVAVVDADEDAVLHLGADGHDLHARLLERRVGRGRAVDHVHAVQQEVLVAALVVHVQQGLAVGRPEAAADGPALLGRQRARLGKIGQRRHPQVQHAVARRHPAEPPAVGADARAGAGWAAEELAATAEQMSAQTSTLLENLKFFRFAAADMSVAQHYSAATAVKAMAAKHASNPSKGKQPAAGKVSTDEFIISSGKYEKF